MYTIGQAAARSGVSVPLLRAWERRYGVVSPGRTPAGYRLYDDEAVARLHAMRRLVEEGLAARQAAARVAALAGDELSALSADGRAEPDRPGVDVVGAAALVERFLAAARVVDPVSAERVLDEAYAATSFETATQGVVLPALVRVGEAWSRGELDVAAEHAASSAILRRIGAAFDAAARPSGAPVVLVGMAEGALHEIGALAFATAARRAGLDAIYLGPNVPADAWLAAVPETGARAVVLGAMTATDVPAVRTAVVRLRRAYPGLVLAVGGRHVDAVAARETIPLPEPISEAVAVLRDALRQR